jgi:hypothetical protein
MAEPGRTRRDIRYIRWLWDTKKEPVRRIVEWAQAGEPREEKIHRFRSAQKWAGLMQDNAESVRSRAKFKLLYWRFKTKADWLKPDPPPTGCNTSGGTPHWGGSASIIEQEVVPICTRHGATIVSRKRAANSSLSISNPDSDHNEANLTAYAADAGTFAGADDAEDIAAELGIVGYDPGNYNHHFIRRCGHTYRIQVLWAVQGHFDHVHVGCRLVA